jgi:electron transfer flavoprotein alpha subunit
MSRLLVIAFSPVDLPACAGFASALAIPFDVLLLTGSGSAAGAEKTLTAGWSELPAGDGYGLAGLAAGFTHIAAPSSMRAKEALGRLAGQMDCGMLSDVTEVVSPTVYRRPVAAGSLVAEVEVLAEPVVITFRPAGFPGEASEAAAEAVDVSQPSQVEIISRAAPSGARPDLGQAKVVVSGGRPLGDAETFERIIGALADKLGGAVGATRAAVDSGIAANELQVGQTGKIVAPELYIAAGISGSTQHLAGIKDSRLIVAINTDADAPIFRVADIGLVADLFQAVPALTAQAQRP